MAGSLGEVPLGIRTGSVVPPDTRLSFYPDLTSLTKDTAKITQYDLAGMQDFLQGETGAKLPEQLVAQLGFAALRWELVDAGQLSLLFIGDPHDSQGPTALANALGTIMLHRITELNGKVIPFDVKVAGVVTDSNREPRVHAVTYSAFSKGAIDLNVSISEYELPMPADLMTRQYYHWTTQSIPTTDFNTYSTAGVITEAMMYATLMQVRPHKRVLRASDSTESGHELRLDEFPRDQGFSLVSTDSDHKLMYTNPWFHRDSSNPSWETSIPRNLETNKAA